MDHVEWSRWRQARLGMRHSDLSSDTKKDSVVKASKADSKDKDTTNLSRAMPAFSLLVMNKMIKRHSLHDAFN